MIILFTLGIVEGYKERRVLIELLCFVECKQRGQQFNSKAFGVSKIVNTRHGCCQGVPGVLHHHPQPGLHLLILLDLADMTVSKENMFRLKI